MNHLSLCFLCLLSVLFRFKNYYNISLILPIYKKQIPNTLSFLLSTDWFLCSLSFFLCCLKKKKKKKKKIRFCFDQLVSSPLMEDHKERNAPWLSVPQFGDWDQKGPLPDYSMDFSKIREMRKQQKTRASLGNEEEFINPTANLPKATTPPSHHNNDNHGQQHSPNTRRSFFSYFNCCVKA
ncbi:hypothetical protein LINGRAHAP2_LOCUS9194 [Linum grandiflorum]